MEFVNIEIKGPFCPGQDMQAAFVLLMDSLRRFHCADRTILSSFGHSWLKEFHERYPFVRTGLLYSETYTPEETVAFVRKYGAWGIHPDFHCIDAITVEFCRKAGIACNLWTVDSPEMIRQAIAYQPTGIITNYPDRVLAQLL